MRRFLKLFTVSLALIVVLSLTGCGKEKREELKFDGDEGAITFNVKSGKKYKISTDSKDLRTSREQAILLGDNFKIGIEFNDTFNYFFDSSFDKLKKARKDSDEYKEVTYSGIKGIQYFYGSYNGYEILLPIEGDKEHFLNLSVYGKEDTEKSAKEAIKSEEVIDVLNNMTFKGKK